MRGFTAEMETRMQAINANLSHTRVRSSASRVFVHNGEEVVEADRPSVIANHSMFPYISTAMAVDPSEVPGVQEDLRKKGVLVEFDSEGRPQITSTKQQDALAKAMGMKTGRDGYGHINEHGKFEHSGRRRNDEIQAGRSKVRRMIKELEEMPEEVPAGVVDGVLGEYDFGPEEDTG